MRIHPKMICMGSKVKRVQIGTNDIVGFNQEPPPGGAGHMLRRARGFSALLAYHRDFTRR
jgi:hypothetical protein